MSKNIASNETYSEVHFKRIELTGAKITNAEFEECRFSHCDFSETIFRACRFVDCEFEDCSLKMLNLDGTVLAGSRFLRCNLIGVDWTHANWGEWQSKMKALEFMECELKYALFGGIELKKFKLQNSFAQEANFSNASMIEADFAGTDFLGAIFHKCDLTKANFVGAKNYAIHLNNNKTKGTKFSLPEAVRLLHYLDIKLIDPQSGEELDENA